MHRSTLHLVIGGLVTMWMLTSSAWADCRQGFDEQPSFSGNCKARPSGSICVKFSDHYIWLIFDSVGGWREETCGKDKIDVAIGFQGQYSHIKGTNLVRFDPFGTVTHSCGGRVATIVGTRGPDRIRGTERDDVIAGLEGIDVIYGLGGKDVICGGDGRDIIYGGSGADWLYGGKGRDALFGEGGNDWLFGQENDDDLHGDVGNDVLDGGSGNDICRGGPDTTQDVASTSCEHVSDVP